MNAMMTTAGALAGKELFKKAVLDLYQYLVNQTGRKLKQWYTERQIEKLYRQIGKVRKVKTIWQIDKAVDLLEFYCDSHVVLNKKRCKITKLSDFKTMDNILIQGIAGQGKSILLRYLCSVELGRGEYIPIFLELRRVSQTDPLKKRIFTAIESLGMDIDDELFDALVASGKILLLLDAFDEVPDELKARVLTDIEDLIARKPNIRVVVTSRPNENIRFSNHFNVIMLDNLRKEEYKVVIKKLASGQTWADTLIDHIEKQAMHIIDLLCTPLIVTLLVLSYKSYKQLPTKLSDFYDALFQTLLQRHDGTKPGFTRIRRCALDDAQYRQAFEALCILAKKSGQQSFSMESIYSLSEEALKQSGLKAIASSYIDDIVKITCLVVRDGEEYRFIHKTVQEYYTASYIRKKAEPWAKEFYKRIKKDYNRQWKQELEFLSEIDSYRYNKYYLLPLILNLVNLSEDDLDIQKGEIRLSDFSNFLSLWFIGIKKDKNKDLYRCYLSHIRCHNSALVDEICHTNIEEFFNAITIELNTIVSKLDQVKNYKNDNLIQLEKDISHLLCVNDLVTMGMAPELSSLIEQKCDKFIKKTHEIWQSTKYEEDSSLLRGLV